MTSLYPGQMEPWQNRPSLIACWEHSSSNFDTGGGEVLVLPQVMDNILLTQVPACIPRACRLTRVCIHYYYQVTSGAPFELEIISSNECTANPVSTTLEFPVGNPDFSPNCFCGDINVIFNECDTWYSQINLGSGTIFPLFRVIYHFELR